MDIFDMFFGSMNNQAQSAEADSFVEQFVKYSVNHLFNTLSKVSTTDLEAEGIYLAAYIYLKNTYQIDFEIDYVSHEIIDKIPSGDYSVADKVFTYMKKYGRGLYSDEEANYGIGGYKMNIQLCEDYGDYIKNYFIRAHKIGEGDQYKCFHSSLNSLWYDGVKRSESQSQRDVFYKIADGHFELRIPPYNPLVTGRVVSQSAYAIKCQSSDGKRTFVFHYVDGDIDSIDMYRNDKGDMVKYDK